MNALRTLLLLPVVGLVVASSVRADDAKLPIQVGGPFEVQTVKHIAYKGAIPLSGVYTIRASERMAKTFGKDAAVCRQASPLAHVHAGLPPFLVMYASKAFPGCGTMSEELCQTLQKNKVEAASLEVKDRDHITIIMRMLRDDDLATQAVLAFVAKHSGLKLTAQEPAKESKP